MSTVTASELIVTLTPAAAKQVRYLMQKKGDPNLGLRVAVKGGGCSGLSYVMSLEPQARPNDLTYESEGIRVFIDPKSARFLRGTTLDYSLKNLLEGGFLFHNPNASRTCGCGTSFQPKSTREG
ncbi:MAG TPA: iron-sulfur cluster assembly accessory protein [Chthonomonadales bacterium]|nr:iron-sulfur cluster assembly accessory protein [Chthonomonadales bacterium]